MIDNTNKPPRRFPYVVAGVAALAACAPYDPKSNERCFLLAVAYDEQAELSGGWYDSAAVELKKCGFEFEHKDGTRGRDPDGYYNAEKVKP